MDHPGSEDFNELLKGYLRESLNPQELDLFFELAGEPANNERLAQSFRIDLENNEADLAIPGQRDEAWKKLLPKVERAYRPVRQMRTALRWVAVVVCLLGATAAIYTFSHSKSGALTARAKSEISTPVWLTAEHVGAMLVLANGDSMVLNNEDKGVITTQDGMQVVQSGGAIHYSGESRSPMFNEIRTVKGKIWRAVLPDQTVVWLNGGSSIKYPLRFGTDARTVEMTGEIYFQVSHHAGYPFQVKTGRLQIEDIGTSFNVKSFGEDTTATTTLLEGVARVTLDHLQATLRPGQQSVAKTGHNNLLMVQQANLAEALAWKNGFFYFNNSGLLDVMSQISDWYQVKVVYKGTTSGELFSGQIDKTLPLSDLLQGLQQPGVKFSLDNRQVTVIQQ
jgi:transmembrane sensor